ncbi:MAG TPA: CHAT domain-containing protein [Mycobacteriales bacterium]|jgi:tetratricopeptide (TPR) repeat protein|nr:CHAT domain-containing protein [Mycobacteriales bacterium]
MNERDAEILIRATNAYVTVVADPAAGGPEAIALVAEARRTRQPEALVAALRAEAWYHRTRLDGARAKRLLDEAVRIARRERLPERLGEVLVTRGVVSHELGRPGAAERDFTAAAGLIAPGMAAELAAQQGALYLNQGRLEEAARLYRRLLASSGLPRDVRAKVANNLGVLETQRGRPQVALGWLDQAAEAAHGVVPTYAAAIAESRAAATVQAGRLTEGLALFGEAAGLWQAAGLPLGELHVEHSEALVELRLLPEAQEQSREAVRLLDMHGMPLMAAEAQLRAAQLTLLRGDLPAAATLAAEVAARFRRQRRASWAARADLVAIEARLRSTASLATDPAAARRAAAVLRRARMPAAVHASLVAGRVAAAADKPAAAAAAWADALALSRGAPVLVRLRGRVAGALAGRLAGDDDAVLRHSRAGLADLARHRASLASYELRVLASGQGVELGRLGLAALVRGGSPARVLDWMERTRAAAVAAVEPGPAGPDTELDAELAAMRAAYAELRTAPGSGRSDVSPRQTELEARIRQSSWLRAAAAPAAAPRLSLASLRGQLGDRVLVEYDVLDGEVIAAVVEPARTRLVRLGPIAGVTFEISTLLFALRRLARGTGRAAAALATARAGLDHLTALLLAPLELPSHSELVVVPVGELQRVPWSAVHPQPVSVAPAAAMWERSARARPLGQDVVLVAGPDVPGGSAEIAALSALHPAATVLRPPASTAGAVVSALSTASLAHLACHGRVRPDNPIFSSLLLADGPLTVHELEARGPAPYRIVLAACESGTEVGYEGNETLGFVSSLLARGSAGLVASAVVVPDWDVVPLMRSLHSSVLRGATLATALFEARSTLDGADPRAFVSWCAFNAFGAA